MLAIIAVSQTKKSNPQMTAAAHGLRFKGSKRSNTPTLRTENLTREVYYLVLDRFVGLMRKIMRSSRVLSRT